MAVQARYEYRLLQVDHDPEQVNRLMRDWAEAGWELVSGNTVTYKQGIHWKMWYAMYWRRPIANA
jgi:hypothetical protein